MVSNAADEIILDPHQIAWHYIRSWFLLDFVSSLPLDYVILLLSPETGVRQIMHAGRLQCSINLVLLADFSVITWSEIGQCHLNVPFDQFF